MFNKLALLFVILFLSSIADAAMEVLYLRVDQENLYLTPRGGRIGKVYGNTRMYKIEEENGWYKVQITGWIPATSVAETGEEIVEVVEPVRGKPLVEITDWHWYTKEGRVYVVGEVRNNTNKTKRFVKIVATFYDANNNPIAKKSGYIDDYHLLPGETGTFAIMKLADPRYKKCGVYVETWGLVFLSE